MSPTNTLKPTGEIIDLWESANRYQQTPEPHKLEAVRLAENLTSDFLVADMSKSARTRDSDKGGDGKERHKIAKIMTVSQAHTSPRTQKDKQIDKQTDKWV